MSKYSYELKKKLVTEYMNGKAGYDYLTKKYERPSTTTVRRWINAYKEFGDAGLMKSSENKKLHFEIKLQN